jgi:cytochrome c oxidase subunit III
MTVTLVFFIVVVGVALWWLLHQLTAKPWLEEGVISGNRAMGMLSYPPAKVGLWVLMTVMAALFVLLTSAYYMRMGYADWRPLQVPKLLWFNTASLVLASAAFYGAQRSLKRAHMAWVRGWLFTGGVLGIVFVVGQLRAWDELRAAGEIVALNPSNSFFYLITGLHGLHILGGLVALGITGDRAWNATTPGPVRLSVELCSTYWHFLLLVWLILFALLTGGADDLGRICGQLFS